MCAVRSRICLEGRFRTILDTQVITNAMSVSARSVKGYMERAMQASWLNGLELRVKLSLGLNVTLHPKPKTLNP